MNLCSAMTFSGWLWASHTYSANLSNRLVTVRTNNSTQTDAALCTVEERKKQMWKYYYWLLWLVTVLVFCSVFLLEEWEITVFHSALLWLIQLQALGIENAITKYSSAYNSHDFYIKLQYHCNVFCPLIEVLSLVQNKKGLCMLNKSKFLPIIGFCFYDPCWFCVFLL